jgi:predicted aldo/keto reductase-like oxidoreductase
MAFVRKRDGRGQVSDIERRQLGSTGLSVTALGFGAMDLGGPPAANEISDDEADRVLNAVLDSGINFIDTAVCYGTSEARIGRAISDRRGEFILATKCGCVPGMPMSAAHVHTAANIRAGVEHSLRTMRTDYIDIAQFHNSLTRSAWEAEGALDELLRLKQEGKVRFIGVSGILPNLAEQVDSGVFDTFQTSTGNITSVRIVGHCSKKPTIMRMKPSYWGWRTRAYGPLVANCRLRCAAYRTFHAEAKIQKPATMSTLLKMCSGSICGSPGRRRSVCSRWPEL